MKGLWLVGMNVTVICFYTSPTTLERWIGRSAIKFCAIVIRIHHSFKLGVVVSGKDFSVETTVVSLLDTMALLIRWLVT